MRMLYTLLTLAAGGYGLFWLTEKNPDLKQKAEEWLDFRSTTAFTIHFDSAQVIDLHQKKLLKEKGSRCLQPELKFQPYLLIEAKYLDQKKRTKESLMLWDLSDGEMVLNAKTWDKTHGFADCILSRAHQQEFKLIHAIAEKGGQCDTGTLLDKSGLEMAILEPVLQGCLRKNLLVQTGANRYRLHLESPKLTSTPETTLSMQLTTQSHKRVERSQKYFSAAQVTRILQVAFGEDFSIRRATEVYLPIYQIPVQKTNGTCQTYYFNGVTGGEIPQPRFFHP